VERGQLDYPEGLQSEFTSELAVDGSMPTLTVTGSIDVLNAIYQKNFSVTQQLFARITSQAQGVNATKATISDQIRMEVEVRTPGPITVKNNVADLEALGSFRIRGTVANPIILGRADVQDGGELYFGAAVSQTLETTQRNDRYTIERGSIDFNNPLQTEPNLEFLATHELNVEDDRRGTVFLYGGHVVERDGEVLQQRRDRGPPGLFPFDERQLRAAGPQYSVDLVLDGAHRRSLRSSGSSGSPTSVRS